LMQAILSDEPTLLCAQTFSEFGTIGVPIALSKNGVSVRLDILSRSEREALSEVGEIVRRKIEALVGLN
ncbi:MAG: hypothetical protein RMK89_14550, partial [Armatimonadota bacterium]|nr:hypothetical protein [Armatimonadota bacterium]MDW8144664.1 hypothetical protein [Armatimonadota bacterium]